MTECTNPKGHQWSDLFWEEADHGWWNEGHWVPSPVTHFRDHTSQMVRCIHCEETAYRLAKEPA